MHFSSIISVAALGLATMVTADYLNVYHYCYFACTHSGYFTTDFGTYEVGGGDGCRGTSVPGMVEFCLDHRQDRGHFRFSHQSYKRCLRVTSSEDSDCGIAACWTSHWAEVPCTWREAPGEGAEEVVSASLTIDGPPTVETPASAKDHPSFVYVSAEDAEEASAEPEKAEKRANRRSARHQ